MSSDLVKVGIIGTGGRGQHFGWGLHKREDSTVVALCDPNPVRMGVLQKELDGDPNCYTSVAEMCDREKLDAVVITSPDRFHVPNALEVLGRGINALIDKPLATSVEGCRAIIGAAERSGKTVMMGFNLRHCPPLKRLKQIVESGQIGKIFMIENREFYDGGRTYMSRWNRKQEMSGGLWIHKGSHDFDIFNWLQDFPKPVKVSATAGLNILKPENLPFPLKDGLPAGPTCTRCAYAGICPDRNGMADNPKYDDKASAADDYHIDLCMYLSDKDVHDNGIATVEYENGARCSHLECFVISLSGRFYTVCGDRGTALAGTIDNTITIYPRWSKDVIRYEVGDVDGGHGGADPGLMDSFIKSVRGLEQNLSTVQQGLWATAIGQAAEISWRENRTVFIDELMK